MEAERGTAEGPVGWFFQSLSMKKLKQWDGSTEMREWKKIGLQRKLRDGERRESVAVFREKEKGSKREGYHKNYLWNNKFKTPQGYIKI